jgi:hypothetical protein
MSMEWTQINSSHWKLDETGIELRQEDRPVPLLSGREFYRSTPGSWSVYLDESAEQPDAVFHTLGEAKEVADVEAAARLASENEDAGGEE